MTCMLVTSIFLPSDLRVASPLRFQRLPVRLRTSLAYRFVFEARSRAGDDFVQSRSLASSEQSDVNLFNLYGDTFQAVR